MRKTLYLYILKEIPPPFFLGVATFTFVLLMGRLLRLADMVVAKGVPISDALRMILYLLPSFLMVTIPMSFLLAILLAFGRLSGDSEITAMKAGGTSLYGLLPPVLFSAILVYGAGAFISAYGVPAGNKAFKSLMIDVLESRVSLGVKERVFNADFPGITIYTDRFDDRTQTMSGILIQDERDSVEPSTIIAANGSIHADSGSRSVRVHLVDGTIHRTSGKSGYRLVAFDNYDLHIDPAQNSQAVKSSEQDMTMAELKSAWNSRGVQPKKALEMRLEYYRRLSLPFACIIFSVLGMPLGIQNRRSGKAAGFSMSILLLLTYYVVLSAFKTLGEKSLLNPLVAAWGPNLLFLIFAVYLFRQTAAEKKLFLLEQLAVLTSWLSRVTRRGQA